MSQCVTLEMLHQQGRRTVRELAEGLSLDTSTVTRVRAGLQALGADIPEGWPDYVLHQMVTVIRDGEEVKLSKRAGSYVTLRDLINEVGRDATLVAATGVVLPVVRPGASRRRRCRTAPRPAPHPAIPLRS